MRWRERLSPAHRRMLISESAIAGRVLVSRGYRTVTSKAELGRLGFGKNQQNTPALLSPVYSPAGKISLYLSRPDEPRIKNGKPVKYEIPGGARMALDVPPTVNGSLKDPAVPLFITEGIKKGDALASRGLCAVALVGVWNFRGRNEAGGKTALAEWEHMALNRTVYIAFDSDVMEKPQVYAALARLKDFLEHQEAKVRLIYLPAAKDGRKQGVDDFFAAGFTVEDLLSRATSELRQPPAKLNESAPRIPYRATPGGLVWDKPVQDGAIPTPLTNFTARIAADVVEDDGAEVLREFEITAELAGRRHTFTIPGAQFAGMGWATEHLGAGAIIYPGFGLKDHARAAVQMLSGDVPARRVYVHTGWREVDEVGEWAYLHAGGAVGRDGRVEEVHTELAGSLVGRTLPEPPDGEDLVEAVRASLALWRLAPESITVPLLGAAFRAAMGSSDLSVHISGPTGEGKTELAALFGQHFGAALDSRNLTSWESTENAIEGQAFQAKDQVMVLDDFAPTGSSYDIQKWHKKADRVLRAKGNLAGRQRMRPDESLKPEKPPRSLILSTGEDVPRGQSLRARMMILELSPGDLDFKRLSRCQQQAAGGAYAQAMASFLRWLAPRYEEVRASVREEHARLRAASLASTSEMHRRTPGIVADLALGLRYFLLFAHGAGVLSEEQARQGWERGWLALGEAAAAQGSHQAAGEPTRRFRELLCAAIASGRAHVAATDGTEPSAPEAWGWRQATVGTGEFEREEWRPQGERIGWLEEEDLYLEPEAAFAAAQKQGRDSGEPLTVSSTTLRKRLDERGLLLSTDKARQILTVRRTLGGSRKGVLHTAGDFLSPLHTKPDQPDQRRDKPHTYRDSMPELWSGRGEKTRPAPDHEPDQEKENPTSREKPDHEPDQEKPHAYGENSAIGRVGRVSGEERGANGRGARTRLTDEQVEKVKRLIAQGMESSLARQEVLGES